MKRSLLVLALLPGPALLAQPMSETRGPAREHGAFAEEVEREPPFACPEHRGPAACGAPSCVVELRESASLAHNSHLLHRFRAAIERSHTEVRLGPEVVLDFDGLPTDFFPLRFGQCVRVVSVRDFTPAPRAPQGLAGPQPTPLPSSPPAIASAGEVGGSQELETEREERLVSGRSPRSAGPELRFGPTHPVAGDVPDADFFLEIRCFYRGEPEPDRLDEGVFLSGFRLRGKEDPSSGDVGIHISFCVNVEITNLEIFGWGGAGVRVTGYDPDLLAPEGCVRDTTDAWTCPEGLSPYPVGQRITEPAQVEIFNNFFHHNVHPSEGGSALGYGVNLNRGGWAHISENLFDENRHAIATSGTTGGYDAIRNLVLRGGGIHDRYPVYGTHYTHQFDVHGDDNCGLTGLFSDSVWNCGNAGVRVNYLKNAFQYRRGNAIAIRGKPQERVFIDENVFPHPGLEDDNWFDDAIYLQTGENVTIGAHNRYPLDTFGRYGICDFDADGVDDLFLATGVTWWYSSLGEFPWSYMNDKKHLLEELRFGYFDDDLRCDVLSAGDGKWWISSGGYGEWELLAQAAGAPLAEVVFGRFDLADADRRPGVTRRTTHAFWRAPDGTWKLRTLPGGEWRPVHHSPIPLEELAFGDFTGDGVTDVLGVVDGRWQISPGAQASWASHNEILGSGLAPLLVADLDDDNVDDLLRHVDPTVALAACEAQPSCVVPVNGWEVSWQGRGPWHTLREPDWVARHEVQSRRVFAGRFGSARGCAVLFVGTDRVGRFLATGPGERSTPASWTSRFAY